MHVLVFESGCSGHRLAYLRMVISAVAPLVDRVTVALPVGAPETEQYRVHLRPMEGQFELDAWMPDFSPKPLRCALQRLRYFGQSVRRCHADHVLVPYADGLAQVIGAAGSLFRRSVPAGVELEGLMMRGSFAYPLESAWQRFQARGSMRAAAMGPWAIMHHLDPLPYGRLAEISRTFCDRSRLMPDPAPIPAIRDRYEARRRLGIPQHGRYVGSVGGSDSRKGIDRLIRAFAAAPLGPDDRLLLVGPIARPIGDMLRGEFAAEVRSGRIITVDRYVTDEELEAGTVAMDLVCTPYPRHIGSSSIVIRAAAADRPVLASCFGWMGYVVPRFSLGVTCDVGDSAGFAGALAGAMDDAAGFSAAPAARRFVRYHSVENFAACWTQRLRERMGLPSAEERVGWEWALGDETRSEADLPAPAVDDH